MYVAWRSGVIPEDIQPHLEAGNSRHAQLLSSTTINRESHSHWVLGLSHRHCPLHHDYGDRALYQER